MAWGYWTCFSSFSVENQRNQLQYQQNNELYYHRSKTQRDRSVERERLINNSAASSDNSSGKHTKNAAISNHQAENHHVEPEKVAFERRLLLGDPDWGSRTIADRNTLPRKKQPEYDKSQEVVYNSSRGSDRRASSKTPPDSISRKSDENFCPACAQNSNRESRVSFGSLASSSRGSSNQNRENTRNSQQRLRSRSQDDEDYSSDARGGVLSSSLPTPPPPPFCSQRDLIRHQASLLETINQKMAFLSAFKLPPNSMAMPAMQQQNIPKYNTIGPSASAYYFSNEQPQPPPPMQVQTPHRSRNYEKTRRKTSAEHHQKSNSREHSSSSLHSLGQRQRDCDNRQTRSSTTSRRTSRSGSRTPRSSRGSRESMASRGSRGSRNSKNKSSSKSLDLSDLHPPEAEAEAHGADDEADNESDFINKPSLPPKPSLVNPPVSFNDNNNFGHSESENSIQNVIGSTVMADSNCGTVRRRSRGSNPRTSRPQSTGEDQIEKIEEQKSQRSSLSQTPEEEDEGDDEDSPRHHRKVKIKDEKSKPQQRTAIMVQEIPSRGATFYSRPRSASIGNRLSDHESHEVHEPVQYHHHHRHYRRHHTLDHNHRDYYEDPETSFVPAAASSRSISSKSEKSSSRSSHSPSVENIRHGMYSLINLQDFKT